MTDCRSIAAMLALTVLQPIAAAQQSSSNVLQEVGSAYGQVVEVTKAGGRASFKLSPAAAAPGCERVSLYTDANGPKKNLPTLRIEQAKASGKVLLVRYMLEPASCTAYVVEANIE